MINFDVQKELGYYSDEEAAGPIEMHHIVYRSHGGVDHFYSKIALPAGFHKGNRGPHLNKKTDKALKEAMQKELFAAFSEFATYDIDDILTILQPENKRSREKIRRQMEKTKNIAGEYKPEDIVRTLMGGRLH